MARVTCDGWGASRFTALWSGVFHQIRVSGSGRAPSSILTSQGPRLPAPGLAPSDGLGGLTVPLLQPALPFWERALSSLGPS